MLFTTLRILMRRPFSASARLLHNFRNCPNEKGTLNTRTRASSKFEAMFYSPIRQRYAVNSLALLETHHTSRSYAKKAKKDKKEKGGKGGKGGKAKVSLTDAELNDVVRFEKMCQQMSHTVDSLKEDYITQLTVRTSIGVLDQLPVETPDGNFPLIQLGQIAQKNPQLVVINLAATPQYIKNVKTAIAESGMNLNPQQDGTTLFVPIPKVTREHRENLAKNAKTLFIKTKDKLKDIHNTYIRDLKKHKDDISQDLLHNVQVHIDEKMKHFVEQAQELQQIKHDELLGEKS